MGNEEVAMSKVYKGSGMACSLELSPIENPTYLSGTETVIYHFQSVFNVYVLF